MVRQRCRIADQRQPDWIEALFALLRADYEADETDCRPWPIVEDPSVMLEEYQD